MCFSMRMVNEGNLFTLFIYMKIPRSLTSTKRCTCIDSCKEKIQRERFKKYRNIYCILISSTPRNSNTKKTYCNIVVAVFSKFFFSVRYCICSRLCFFICKALTFIPTWLKSVKCMINGKQKLISNTYKINNSASCFFYIDWQWIKINYW